MNTPWCGCLSRGVAIILLTTVALGGLRRASADELDVLTDVPREQLRGMLRADVRARLREANLRDLEAWRKITLRDEWERLRAKGISALRASLGAFPQPPKDLSVVVTGTIEGKGHFLQKLLFESRQGLWVTAHLYVPQPPPVNPKPPGILLCHSHHNPKQQSELQDMGVMWARAGCVVLVMDQLGHGERRQHPFQTAADYPQEFRVSRQDYYFRYDEAIQLSLVGDSLIGWMTWDLQRGVDLLLQHAQCDPKKIILLGSVAGGGDPAAVTAALDDRIACAVPFNFGGPQPETTFPLPEDAETAFSYSGSGSWESTRNLRLSARNSFLPWLIVGSVAPRKLIYAHEFSWDRDSDPVWKRFQTIYGFYNARDNLAFTHGYGLLRQSASEASHCNNIGPTHREAIHKALAQWFGIPLPDESFRQRRDPAELLCLAGPQAGGVKMKPLHELAAEVGAQRAAEFAKAASGAQVGTSAYVRNAWRTALGDIEPYEGKLQSAGQATWEGHPLEKLVLRGDRDVLVAALLMRPKETAAVPPGGRKLILAVCRQGKAEMLKARAAAIKKLLDGGAALCLVEVRGTGETSPGDDRGRTGEATGISSTEMMLGQTLLGLQLKDLRTLLRALLARNEGGLDGKHVAVWGDSLAAPNAADVVLAVPHGISPRPRECEPMGAMLALLLALFEPEHVSTIGAEGGISSWRSVLGSPFCYVPHDAVVPGAIAIGDVDQLAAALAPRPLWLSRVVDGQNRLVTRERLSRELPATRKAYFAAQKGEPLKVAASGDDVADWLIQKLGAGSR